MRNDSRYRAGASFDPDDDDDDYIGVIDVVVTSPDYSRDGTDGAFVYDDVDDDDAMDGNSAEVEVECHSDDRGGKRIVTFVEDLGDDHCSKEDDDDDMSDPDEADYWYATDLPCDDVPYSDMDRSPTNAIDDGADDGWDDDVPEIDVAEEGKSTYGNNTGCDRRQMTARRDVAANSSIRHNDTDVEAKFYQFAALIVLRHLPLGQLCPPRGRMFRSFPSGAGAVPGKTNHQGGELRTMTTRKLQFANEDEFEVIPRLKGDDDEDGSV